MSFQVADEGTVGFYDYFVLVAVRDGVALLAPGVELQDRIWLVEDLNVKGRGVNTNLDLVDMRWPYSCV